MADTLLDVVDENDEVIGQEMRSVIHKNGLLHREIHVWFITPDKQIVFQKRAANKDTFPGYLDATAGGHVERGMTYEQAAIAEIAEETGLSVAPHDIHFLDKRSSDRFDEKTGMRNHALRSIYGYLFKGNINDLTIENGFGAGFKAYSLEKIFNPSQSMLDEIIPRLIEPSKYYIFRALEKLVSK